jgi:hypothetical protein
VPVSDAAGVGLLRQREVIMRPHDCPTASLIASAVKGGCALLVLCAVLLGSGAAKSQEFEYAAKFICGTVAANTPAVLARGTYFTAINVHNPFKDSIGFQKKIAIALPGEKAGKVTKFFDAGLKPDEALEIDCPDILKHAEARGFLKGFVVIESKVELDIVAVYSAAASATGTVTAMEMERVPARKK